MLNNPHQRDRIRRLRDGQMVDSFGPPGSTCVGNSNGPASSRIETDSRHLVLPRTSPRIGPYRVFRPAKAARPSTADAPSPGLIAFTDIPYRNIQFTTISSTPIIGRQQRVTMIQSCVVSGLPRPAVATRSGRWAQRTVPRANRNDPAAVVSAGTTDSNRPIIQLEQQPANQNPPVRPSAVCC